MELVVGRTNINTRSTPHSPTLRYYDITMFSYTFARLQHGMHYDQHSMVFSVCDHDDDDTTRHETDS